MSNFSYKGLNFYYRIDGENHEKTIVFLNGVMASVNSWAYFVKPLTKYGFKVIRLDFRGQKRSDKPVGPYTFTMHAEDTIALLDYLNIKQAHFIGTSYGGEVGIKIAALYPSYVNKLILINSAPVIDESLRKTMHSFIAFASSKDATIFMQGTVPFLYSDAFLETQGEQIEQMIEAMKNLSDTYYEGQMTLYETFLIECDLLEDCKKIEQETLIIGSSLDLLKPMHLTIKMHEVMKHSHLVEIPDAAHVSILEKPALILNLIKGHLL